MPRLEPAALDKLAHFAKDASSGEAGWVTTRAIGRVMQEDFKRTGNARPYLDKLLTIGTESPDEQVRYLALEMEMHAEAPLDTQDTDRLAKILATEGSEDVRQVAAHDLSLSEDKTRVLEHLHPDLRDREGHLRALGPLPLRRPHRRQGRAPGHGEHGR